MTPLERETLAAIAANGWPPQGARYTGALTRLKNKGLVEFDRTTGHCWFPTSKGKAALATPPIGTAPSTGGTQ